MSRLPLVIVFCVLVALCSSAPRQKRGFRNAALSTARGFGKRMPHSDGLEDLSSADFSRPMASSLLAEQVARNKALAKLLVEKVLDQNGDGLINPEEIFQTL